MSSMSRLGPAGTRRRRRSRCRSPRRGSTSSTSTSARASTRSRRRSSLAAREPARSSRSARTSTAIAVGDVVAWARPAGSHAIARQRRGRRGGRRCPTGVDAETGGRRDAAGHDGALPAQLDLRRAARRLGARPRRGRRRRPAARAAGDGARRAGDRAPSARRPSATRRWRSAPTPCCATTRSTTPTRWPRRSARPTAAHGVTVAYDGVGRATFDASLAALAPRGMLALFGASSGQVPPFDLQRLNHGGSLFVTRPTLGALPAHSRRVAVAGRRGARRGRRRVAARRDRWPLRAGPTPRRPTRRSRDGPAPASCCSSPDRSPLTHGRPRRR